jgi:hypothetical protein
VPVHSVTVEVPSVAAGSGDDGKAAFARAAHRGIGVGHVVGCRRRQKPPARFSRQQRRRRAPPRAQCHPAWGRARNRPCCIARRRSPLPRSGGARCPDHCRERSWQRRRSASQPPGHLVEAHLAPFRGRPRDGEHGAHRCNTVRDSSPGQRAAVENGRGKALKLAAVEMAVGPSTRYRLPVASWKMSTSLVL